MKQIISLLALTAILNLVAGCGDGKPAPYVINTTEIVTEFANTSGPLKDEVNQVVSALNANDITTAITHLQTASKIKGLTEEEVNGLFNAVAQIQKWMTNTAEAYGNEEYQNGLKVVTDELAKAAAKF